MAAMTLTRHIRRYAISGLLQWALEYALVLVLSQWLLPIAAANVIAGLQGELDPALVFNRDALRLQKHAAA